MRQLSYFGARYYLIRIQRVNAKIGSFNLRASLNYWDPAGMEEKWQPDVAARWFRSNPDSADLQRRRYASHLDVFRAQGRRLLQRLSQSQKRSFCILIHYRGRAYCCALGRERRRIIRQRALAVLAREPAPRLNYSILVSSVQT